MRGTYWYTQDRCDGTFFRTREGVVDVRDFGKAKTVPVKAGQKYLARVALREPPQLRHQAAGPHGPERRGRDGARSTASASGCAAAAKPKVRVDLRGRPKQRIRVRINLTLSSGETLNGVREYRTCTPRVSDRTPPRL